jgi:GT2 family glycosyltransferase
MSDRTSRDRSWSVVVPTRGRPSALRRCLEALARQDRDAGEIEIVVVDDDPAGSAAGAAAGLPIDNLVELRSGGRGPAAARNAGARAAAGSILAFTDDDCVPEPGWLAGFGKALGDGAQAAAGRTVNGAPGPYATASQLVVAALTRAGASAGAPRFAASNNVCFEAAAFAALGGFDEAFPLAAGEDRDLCARWVASGRAVADAPGARILHIHELGVGGLWRQHYRYGRGARSLHSTGGGAGGPRLAEQGRFYRELALGLRELSGDRVRAGAAALLSQVAHACGYTRALVGSGAHRQAERTATTTS